MCYNHLIYKSIKNRCCREDYKYFVISIVSLVAIVLLLLILLSCQNGMSGRRSMYVTMLVFLELTSAGPA